LPPQPTRPPPRCGGRGSALARVPRWRFAPSPCQEARPIQAMTGHAQKGDWHWHQALAAVASRRLVNPRITLKRPPSVSSEASRRTGGDAGGATRRAEALAGSKQVTHDLGCTPTTQNGRVGPARAEEPVRRMASSNLFAVCGWQAGGALGSTSGWGPPVHRRDRGPEGVRSGKLVWSRGAAREEVVAALRSPPPFR
jgi:hypothetical protein